MKLRPLMAGLFVAALAAGIANQAQAGEDVTTQVWSVDIVLSGVQGHENTNDNSSAVAKVSANSALLVNAARNRPFSATVPTNEVLALGLSCQAEGGFLMVWDTAGNSNLVTIAELQVDGVGARKANATKGKAVFTMVGSLASTEGSNYRINGGWLAFSGSAPVDFTSPCQPESLSANTIIGQFQGFDGEDFDVVVTKGKMKTLTHIGQFP